MEALKNEIFGKTVIVSFSLLLYFVLISFFFFFFFTSWIKRKKKIGLIFFEAKFLIINDVSLPLSQFLEERKERNNNFNNERLPKIEN